MEAQKIGIILKVSSLEVCKNFYRELLDCGETALDSSFLTEFRLPDGSFFILEQTQAKYLEHASGTAAMVFEFDDVERVREKLERSGYELTLEETGRSIGILYRTRDVEGNEILLKRSAGGKEDTADVR